MENSNPSKIINNHNSNNSRKRRLPLPDLNGNNRKLTRKTTRINLNKIRDQFVTSDGRTLYVCQYCNKLFPNKRERIGHIKNCTAKSYILSVADGFKVAEQNKIKQQLENKEGQGQVDIPSNNSLVNGDSPHNDINGKVRKSRKPTNNSTKKRNNTTTNKNKKNTRKATPKKIVNKQAPIKNNTVTAKQTPITNYTVQAKQPDKFDLLLNSKPNTKLDNNQIVTTTTTTKSSPKINIQHNIILNQPNNGSKSPPIKMTFRRSPSKDANGGAHFTIADSNATNTGAKPTTNGTTINEDTYIENNDHLSTDNNNEDNIEERTCKRCNKIFPTAIVMLRHAREQHKYPKIVMSMSEVRKYYAVTEWSKCPICDKPLRNNYRSSYLRHLHTHANELTFSCNVCHQKFRRSDHMKQHAKRHVIKEGKLKAAEHSIEDLFDKVKQGTETIIEFNDKI